MAAWVTEGRVDATEVIAPSGTRYQLEVVFVWDDKPNADVRVIASVDAGGIRALLPTSDDFIVSPQGRFVGE